MRRALWLLTILVVVLLGVTVWFSVHKQRLPIEVPVGKGCQAQTESGTVHLYPEQMANAATIAAVGVVNGVPDRGIVVALATAMQESDLYNLTGGDRDSIGLFQQRPSMGWGAAEDVADPRYAAGAFYRQLLLTPGWQDMRLTEAAQAVQRSAYPEAYEKWADEAEVLGQALVGESATAITCVKVNEPTLRGNAAAQALAANLRLDWGQAASTAVATGGTSLSVVAGHQRAGWQIAHWLVAHSADQNVSRVRFNGQEWTIQSGQWRSLPPPGDSVLVVSAEVYPG